MKAWLLVLSVVAFLNLDKLGRLIESLPPVTRKPARKRKKVRFYL